jgi:hypothetical protein
LGRDLPLRQRRGEGDLDGHRLERGELELDVQRSDPGADPVEQWAVDDPFVALAGAGRGVVDVGWVSLRLITTMVVAVVMSGPGRAWLGAAVAAAGMPQVLVAGVLGEADAMVMPPASRPSRARPSRTALSFVRTVFSHGRWDVSWDGGAGCGRERHPRGPGACGVSGSAVQGDHPPGSAGAATGTYDRHGAQGIGQPAYRGPNAARIATASSVAMPHSPDNAGLLGRTTGRGPRPGF